MPIKLLILGLFLCNIFYKIIEKILTNMLNEVMHLLIHYSQACFIKGRLSMAIIILINEITNEFSLGSLTEVLCANLDIKKAFDSVNIRFIIKRLFIKGLLKMFINRIKACIDDIHFSIYFNCSMDGLFSSSNGLR